MSHTPFNYDYVGSEHTTYHIKLTIGDDAPIYSYQSAFDDYVVKIENNYIYFNDSKYGEDGYIANNTEIKLEYKFKLQPGILERKHFLMVVLPWTNVFNTLFDGMVSSQGDGISYREKFRKLSGSSIISPFEYSLSINDTYHLLLTYRLNQRDYFEEKFEIDYRSDLVYTYLKDGMENFVEEFEYEGDHGVTVYYYDLEGRQKFLDQSSYNLNAIDHEITLYRDGNELVTPNDINEFYVAILPKLKDFSFKNHKFSYDPSVPENVTINSWNAEGGENAAIIPNLNAFYYLNQEESTKDKLVCHTSQLDAYLEKDDILTFNISKELSWFDNDLYTDIKAGDVISLYLDTSIENYESLEGLKVDLYDHLGIMQGFTKVIPIEDIVNWDFMIKIELPYSQINTLETVKMTPLFRSDGEFSINNTIGVPRFELVEWDEDMTAFDANGTEIMLYPVDYELLTDIDSLEIAYLFNEELEYLALPPTIGFNWTEEDLLGITKVFTLHIPNSFLNPENKSEILSFTEGDSIILRYQTPLKKAIKISIGELYFNREPSQSDFTDCFAEVLLINANGTDYYSEFLKPYNYNISLPITPFHTEFSGTYAQIAFELNVTELESFATDGYLDFSHLLISVPNPGHELTIYDIAIVRETLEPSEESEFIYDRVWKYTELEEFVSDSVDPTENDAYVLTLENKPMFYYDADQSKWLDRLKIYDDNYNYYSAGLKGSANEEDYQLLYNTNTKEFTWNAGFDKFQEYWGMEIELPAHIDLSTTLYFEYCTNQSWTSPKFLQFENIDVDSLSLTYQDEFWLVPRYEIWYGEIVENNDYDYETEQFYSESFVVYDNTATKSYTFETDYDFISDFCNLSLYNVIGLHPNMTEVILEDDDINYDIIFYVDNKTVGIKDLNSQDGLLDIFDSIAVTLNFTFGPISSVSKIKFSDYFNSTYLTELEDSFYDYCSYEFTHLSQAPEFLLAESHDTFVSDSTSFSSIDYSRSSIVSDNNKLRNYNSSDLYFNAVIFEDPFNTVYEADVDGDGAVDYKQEIDIDKDGRIDITKYGVQDAENAEEVIWYRIIQDFESVEVRTDNSDPPEKHTYWFDVTDVWESVDPVVGTAINQGLLGHYKAARIVDEEVSTTETAKVKFYSVKIDSDLDGYADEQVNYKRSSVSVSQIETYYKETLIFGSIFDPDPVLFMITREGLDSGDRYNDLFEPNVVYYSKRAEMYVTERISEHITEEITYIDWEEGEVTQTRTYRDNFIDDSSKFNSEEDITTLSITDLKTGQEFAISSNFPLSSPSEIEYSTERWGVDEVPVKFDTFIREDNSGSQTECVYDRYIFIDLPSRFSLYHEYLEPVAQVGSTIYEVLGVFITPEDGVYYTSDVDDFKEGSAKTEGHYLFYDSDKNGFYETIFVLAPTLGDNIFTVIAFGYNYDGKHDFVPYELVKVRSLSSSVAFDRKFYEGESVTSQILHASFDVWVDLIYPDVERDNYVVKDPIFDVTRMVTTERFGHCLPDLFYEVYKKEYGTAWRNFNEQKTKDILDQTLMTFIAGLASTAVSVATEGNTLAAAGTFALVYFILSLINQAVKEEYFKNAAKAKEYVTDGYPSEPKSLSQKTDTDKLFDTSLWAFQTGHPEAYYTTVTGGELGNMYTSQVIATPRKAVDQLNTITQSIENVEFNEYENVVVAHNRREGEAFIARTFSRQNLNYFIVTSELAGFRRNSHYEFHTGGSQYNNAVANLYRYNTLGYLDKYADELTKGLLDSVRPTCVNGIPQYTLVDSKQPMVGRTQPLSPLYKPIVISQERYDELISQGINPYAKLQVKTQVETSVLSAQSSTTDGINAYELDLLEQSTYAAKIPLAAKEGSFEYPIHRITLDLVRSEKINPTRVIMGGEVTVYYETEELILHTIELDASDYVLDGGNLYFTSELYDILTRDFGNDPDSQVRLDHFYAQGKDLFYYVNIYFPTIIPDTTLSTPIASKIFGAEIDESNVALTPIDTSNQLGRVSLAQSLQHIVGDYMNLFTVAAQGAYGQAELEYTIDITFQSTLYSSIILLPVTIMAGYSNLQAASVKSILSKGTILQWQDELITMAVKSIIGVGVASVAEVFEEIYIDALVESYIEGQFKILGWDAKLGNILSMIVTSFREGIIGPGAQYIGKKMGIGSSSGSSSSVQQAKVDGVNTEQKVDIVEEIRSQVRESKPKISVHIQAETVVSVAMAATAFLIGGFGAGLGSLAPAVIGKFGDLDTYVKAYASVKSMSSQQVNHRRDLTQLADKIEKFRELFAKPTVEAKQTIIEGTGGPSVSIAPHVRAISVMGAVMSTAYYAESVLGISGDQKELFSEAEVQDDRLQTLKSSAVSLQGETSGDVEVTTIKLTESLEENLAEMTDPLIRFRGKIFKILWDAKEKVSFKGYIEKVYQALRRAFPEVSNDFEITLYFGGYILQVGTEIKTFKQDGTEVINSIMDDMDILEVLDSIGYDYSQQALDKEKHIIDAIEIGTPEEFWTITEIKGELPSGTIYTRKSDKVIELRKRLLPLLSNNYKLIDNILLKESDAVIEEFANELEIKANRIKSELNINDKNFKDKTLEKMKDLFDEKYLYSENVLGRPLSQKEQKWNSVMENYFKNKFEKEINKLSNEVRDYLLSGCLQNSMLIDILDVVDSPSIKNADQVFDKLAQVLYSNHLVERASKIYENFIQEVFGLFFFQPNVQDLNRLISTISGRIGAFAEVDVFLKFLPNALKHTYSNQEIAASSTIKIIDKFYFGYGKELMGSEPFYLDGSDNWRYPDLSNWLFIAGQLKEAIIRVQPIKFISDSWDMKHILADLLSSLYVQARLNLKESSKNKGLLLSNIQIEASLISLIQNEGRFNNFDKYFKLVLNELGKLNFYSLFGRDYLYKSSKRILGEEKIIESVNKEIWKTLNKHNPTPQEFLNELKKLSSDVDFIIDNIINEYISEKIFSVSDKSKIQDFLRALANTKIRDFETQFSELEIVDDSNSIIQAYGIDRTSDFNYYRQSEVKLIDTIETISDGYRIGGKTFKEIFVLKRNHPEPITSLGDIRNRAFRIIHDSDGHLGLAEISHKKLVDNPNGWLDGYIANNKLVKNAMLTEFSGFLLSSTFYNLDQNVFEIRSNEKFNNEFIEEDSELNPSIVRDKDQDNNDVKYGIRVLFSFAKSDSNKYMHTLLKTNLINPAFAPETSLIYHEFPTELGRKYFENIETSELFTFKSSAKSMDTSEDFVLKPIDKDKLPITSEDMFKAFLEMYDFKNLLTKDASRTTKERYVLTFIRNVFGALNMRYDPFSGEVDPSSRREISDIENIFTELFNNNEEVRDFLFLKENSKGEFVPATQSHFDSGEYTIKKWLHSLLVKIKDYNDENSHILQAQKLLVGVAKNSIDIDTEGKYFNKDNGELQAGKTVMDVVNKLFGHITIMFVFTHMVDFYQSEGKYKIDIVNTPNREGLLDSVRKFSIKTLIKTTQIETPLGRKVILENLFPMYFLNPFLHLPLQGGLEGGANAIFFGYSPLPFVHNNIKQSTLKDLNVEIKDRFYGGYYKHFSDLFSGSGTKDTIRDMFYLSGNEMYRIVESKIDQFIDFINLPAIQEKSLRNRLVLAAEREIFDMLNYMSKDGSYNLRMQIENLLIGVNRDDLATDTDRYYRYDRGANVQERKIVFNTVLVDGQPFTLRFSKSDFDGTDIRIWRSAIRHHESNNVIKFRQEDINYKYFNKGAIDDKIEILKQLIDSNGGKVKIYLAANVGEKHIIDSETGEITSVIPYGYQYAYNTLKSILPPASIGEEARHIVIDLAKTQNGKYIDALAEMKLEFVAAVTLSYAPSQTLRKNTMDFLFVMKEYDEDITYKYEKVICMFDRNKFYDLGEIYSTPSNDKLYKQITITTFENDLNWEKLTTVWGRNSRYMLVNYEQIYSIYGFSKWW
jgi:hypothetical protein